MINDFSLRGLLLLGTAMATAFGATAVQAQHAAPDDEEIIVTGSIVAAQQAAIEAKRIAPNLVDIASSDSVGRFPDENIAAALSRLPGVAVQLDQGQARYIQVRGAPNRWTTVSIDGIPQTGTDEGGEGRAYRFDSVPAVLLSQLRINKSLTPDITAEAISANIDLRSFSALGTNGFQVTGDVGYGFMDLGKGGQYQGSLRASYGGDNWGIVVGASTYKRRQVTDNREADGYTTGTDGSRAPTDIDIRNYILDRSTNGAFGALEYAPTDSERFYVRGIYTEFKDDEQRNAYQFELDEALSGSRTELTGDLIGVPVDGAFNDAKYRNRNYVYSAGMVLDYEDWGGEVALGYTKTENTTYLPLTLTGATGLNSVSLTYDRSQDPRFPVITGLFRTEFDIDPVTGARSNPRRGAPIDAFDPTSFNGFTSLLPIDTSTVSDAYTAKMDLWKKSGDFTMRLGGLGQVRDIKGNIFQAGILPLQQFGFNINDYAGDEPWKTGMPLGIGFTYTDNEQLDDDQEALIAANNIDLSALIAPTAFFDQSELVLAGYAMGEYETDELLLIAGVRAEVYEIRTAGTSVVGTTATPIDVSQRFVDFFPSVNVRYNVSDNFVLRVAGQRGTARPAYAQIRAGNSISDQNATISGGNPSLRPEYTWGLDASAEYYLPGNGIASVAVFSRWVDDVLYASSQIIGNNSFNSNGIDRSGYRLTSTFNGNSGQVRGVEFNLQYQFQDLPGLLSGFGVQGNLTLLDGEFDAVDETGALFTSGFPGLSDTILNASVFYERGPVSARVAYQRRSDFLTTVAVGVGDGTTRQGFENLDITLRYALTENFTLFADLANLTNEIYSVYEGSREFPNEVEQIGSRYMFGVRFNF